MRWAKRISMVDAHAEGEVGRVITGGVLDVPGATMFDKRQHLQNEADGLRRFCLFEPRGSVLNHANLLLPPVHPEADAGMIIMEPTDYPVMSGTNAMCVATVLLETGLLPMTEPETRFTLDTPGGLVLVLCRCRDGKVETVTLDNVPSFATHLGVPLEVEGLPTLTVDIAYGGAFFVLVDAAACGFAMERAEARDMVDLGERIKRTCVERYPVAHPDNPEIRDVTFTHYCGAGRGDREWRNAIVISPGRLDRSPCGTGVSARMAAMAARGAARPGERHDFYSLIGSHMTGEIASTTRIGDYDAIVPRITGRAWIHATHELGWDPSDPWPEGFFLNDAWGTGMKGRNPS